MANPKMNTKELVKLSEEGKSVKEIRAFILFTYGKEGKEVTTELENAGISSARGKGTAEEFYLLLKTGVMSNEAFEAWIGGKTKNTVNHKSHYNGIRLLTNSIHGVKK